MKFIKWLVALPKKTKIISAIIAGTIVVSSGVGIGIALNKNDDSDSGSSIEESIDSSISDSSLDDSSSANGDSSHAHNFTKEVMDNAYLKTPATCESKAVYYYACECGKQGEATFEYGSSLGHDTVQHEAQAPTCIAIGWNAYETCTRCTYTTYAELPLSEEHGWDAGTILTPATCTQEGTAFYTCTVCKNATKTGAVAALGHDWDEEELQALTCTQDKISNAHCQRANCGEEKTLVTKAQGHLYGKAILVKSATCYQSGEEKQVCTVCSNESINTLPSLEHAYSPIGIEVVDNSQMTTYQCAYCFDTQVLSEGEDRDSLAKTEYLFDCQENFTFNVISDGNEEYIRNNMRFINAYFSGTEYESSEIAQVSYKVTSLDNKQWRISPTTTYQAGQTYLVELREDVKFADYRARELYFQTYKEETKVAELKDNVKFLKSLESNSPGYYPYEITVSEQSERMWLRIGKTDNLAQGDILCIGEIETTEELLNATSNDIYFGKVESMRQQIEGGWLIELSCPAMNEVFEKLDINLSEEVNFEDNNLDFNTALTEETKSVLYSDEEFIKFLSTMELAARKYIKERKYHEKVFANKTIADYLDIETEYRREGLMLYITVLGSAEIPLEYGDEGESLGDIKMTFSLDIEAGFRINLACSIDTTWWGWPIDFNYLDVQLVRHTLIHYTFDLSIDAKYELSGDVENPAKEYVINVKSKNKVLHVGSCKHVESIKNKENLQKVSAEEALRKYCDNECTPCGTCCPIDRMISTQYLVHSTNLVVHTPNCSHIQNLPTTYYYLTYDSFSVLAEQNCTACTDCKPELREERGFQEHLMSDILSADLDAKMAELKDALNSSTNEPEQKSRLHVATISYAISAFHVDVDLSIVFTFSFEATVHCEYKTVNDATYGVMVTKGGPHFYSTKDDNIEKREIEIIGKLSIKAGASIDISAGLIGLKWLANIGIDTEAGIYAKANGIISIDKVAQESFMAAYLELGTYVDVDGHYKVLVWSGRKDLNYIENPFYQLGYDKAYYNFVDRIETITTDGDYTLSAKDLLTVKYYDMHKMQAAVETLNINGAENLYDVNFRLENGTYCNVVNGKIIIKDNAPMTFTDTLYISVVGLADGAHYIKGCSLFFLTEYAVTIEYDNSGHEWVEVDRLSPTCTEEGYVHYVCQNNTCATCNGTPQEKYEALIAKGHTIITEDTVLQTCTEDGHTMTKYCNECDYVAIEKGILPATGHNIIKYEGKEATCIEIGWAPYEKCWNPRCSYTTYREIKIGPHNLVNNICTLCGKKASQGLSYQLSDDKTYYIVNGIGTCKDKNLIIPNTYNGLPIKEIADYAFEYCNKLSSVVIGNDIIAIGYSAFSECFYLTSVVIGNSVTSIDDDVFYNCKRLTSVVIGNGITEISSGIFLDCVRLINVIIPNSVTSIGQGAFSGCSSLTSITIPNSVTSIGFSAFRDCSSLKSITIPDSVTYIGSSAFSNTAYYNNENNWNNGVLYIGNYLIEAQTSISGAYTINENTRLIASSAFENCVGLTSITIPDSVTTINSWAFDNCSSLTSVYYNGDIASWCKISFNFWGTAILYYADNLYINDKLVTELIIPDGVTSIGNYAFSCYSSLTSVVIGDSVTTIGDEAFYGCSSLISVVIGNDVTSIGDGAFSNCDNLTSVVIGDSVTSIGDGAFSNCDNLTSVVIGDSVTSIGYSAFSRCNSLTSITIPDSVTSIGERAFKDCSSLASVVIGDSVTYIGEEAFRDCSSLASVTIGDSVTSIGYRAFSSCDSLTSITIPDSVTYIGDAAFYNCRNLTSITIPNSVTYIGSRAFYGCSSLTSITIPDSVTSIGGHTFYGCDNLTNIIFEDTSTWYKTTSYDNWRDKRGGKQTSVTDDSTNATYFTSTYKDYYWYKK